MLAVSFLLKVDSCQQHQGICIGHGRLTEKHSFQTEAQVDLRHMCFVVASVGAGRGLAWGGMWSLALSGRESEMMRAASSVWHTAQLGLELNLG